MFTRVKKAGLRVRVLAALFVLMTSVEVVSAELDRESFSLVGEALVEVGPFDLDVYQVRHFTRNANETLVELTYLRDVPRYLSLKGWDKGFEHIASVPDLKVAMDWVRYKNPDLKEGDRFAYNTHWRKQNNFRDFSMNWVELLVCTEFMGSMTAS